MHKSGTTLAAQIFHESGTFMGNFDPGTGYDEGNKYESREPHDLNIEMLGCKYDESSLNVSKVLKPEDIKPEMMQKLAAFVKETQGRYADWGFKDPRTCLTYSVWRKVLPEHKLIIIFRSPVELWLHYKPKKFFKSIYSVLICWKALKGWYIYNKEILKVLRAGQKNCFVMEYGHLMGDERYFKSLCEFTGRVLHDSRSAGLYRNKGKKRDMCYRLSLFLQKHILGRDVWGLYCDLKKYEK